MGRGAGELASSRPARYSERSTWADSLAFERVRSPSSARRARSVAPPARRIKLSDTPPRLHALEGAPAMNGPESHSPSGEERRKAERLNERCRVAFRRIRQGGGDEKRIAGETLNLSASGLCVVSPEAVPPDSQIALEMALEGLEGPVMAIGRVVWCDQERGAFRLGICFTWLREQDRKSLAVIADYVRSRSKG